MQKALKRDQPPQECIGFAADQEAAGAARLVGPNARALRPLPAPLADAAPGGWQRPDRDPDLRGGVSRPPAARMLEVA